MYLYVCEYMPQDILSFGDWGNWELPDRIWELGTKQGPLEARDLKHSLSHFSSLSSKSFCHTALSENPKLMNASIAIPFHSFFLLFTYSM